MTNFFMLIKLKLEPYSGLLFSSFEKSTIMKNLLGILLFLVVTLFFFLRLLKRMILRQGNTPILIISKPPKLNLKLASAILYAGTDANYLSSKEVAVLEKSDQKILLK